MDWRWTLGFGLVWAQLSIRDSAIAFAMPAVAYGGYWPGADLGRRFGYLNTVQVEAAFKVKRHWTCSLAGLGLVGDQVREPAFLASYVSPSMQQAGYLVLFDEYSKAVSPRMQAAGWGLQLRVGKIFPRVRLPRHNPNCGPFVELGLGYLRHRISLNKARSERLPLLEGDYLKGIDRLTAGWGVTEAVGYRFFSNALLLNFYLALEAGQFFTQSLRGYQYDGALPDRAPRRDFWVGFRLGWVLPLYEKAPLDE